MGRQTTQRHNGTSWLCSEIGHLAQVEPEHVCQQSLVEYSGKLQATQHAANYMSLHAPKFL
jgi:hypothetical protein